MILKTYYNSIIEIRVVRKRSTHYAAEREGSSPAERRLQTSDVEGGF